MTPPSKEELAQIDFSKFFPYTEGLSDYYGYLYHQPGQEHYKVLAWLSGQCETGDIIVDAGTYRGLSALALSYNENVRVISYDIDHSNLHPQIRARANVEWVEEDINEQISDITKAKYIFLDVDPHDGIQEAKFFDLLREVNYKGVVLMDDIRHGLGTPEFWDSIPEHKEDISRVGHHSGTGVIYFNGQN
jgi:hypothetical protein